MIRLQINVLTVDINAEGSRTPGPKPALTGADAVMPCDRPEARASTVKSSSSGAGIPLPTMRYEIEAEGV